MEPRCLVAAVSFLEDSVVPDQRNRRRFAIVGGVGALGAADAFFKLVKALPARSASSQPDILFEQHPFREEESPGGRGASQNGRKIYVFDMIQSFAARHVDTVLLPCFLSHTFIDEIAAEATLPVVNMMEALCDYVRRYHPDVRSLGVLTSDYVRDQGLFERYFPASEWTLRYPADDVQRDCVMPAIYGPDGIKAGCLRGASVEKLLRACEDLAGQGAELILPGFSEIPVVIDVLHERGIPIIDANQIYADYAASGRAAQKARPFKIGVVGGVGPAATVDFMNKIVRNTPAKRDQEHLKVVVEQNPQIPDRTENLLGNGVDPTIALYSTCKKLEADEADIIAIPCNTAHAFVERIQPYLSIPIVNMLFETVEYIKKCCKGRTAVGLLATSGTIGSRVYHDVIVPAGFELIVPDTENQKRVMDAIYGPQGVKAGFTTGQCVDDLMQAMTSLVVRGAEIIVLGCTELPLLVERSDALPVAGKTVVVLDPTDILAKKCVSLGTSSMQRAEYGGE